MKFSMIGDAYIIENNQVDDNRGSFLKVYNKDLFLDAGIDFEPMESYLSSSYKNVIRGMHFQTDKYAHGKLVTCIKGKVLDVFIDLRRNSESYGKVHSFELSSENRCSIYLPPGYGHGFLSLMDDSTMIYQVSTVYKKEYDSGINPLTIDFEWPVNEPIISERDLSLINFNQFQSNFIK